MTDHVTDEMVEAAWDDGLGALLTGQFDWSDMRSVIEAAWAAAPTDPHVRCDECGALAYGQPVDHDGCDDPAWRTLLLGPPVEHDEVRETGSLWPISRELAADMQALEADLRDQEDEHGNG